MSDVRQTAAFVFEEAIDETWSLRTELKQIYYTGQSDFQKVQVIETAAFGRTLVMDDKTQSAETDEKVYHESLVHPAMLSHPNPKTVFIGGGGEFATAREVLRHKSVEKVVMVDIDKVACDMCREHLPEWNDGAYEDPRFEVYYEDAKGWLENCGQTFDVIIMDICDPIEAGPGIALYFQEFYEFARTKALNQGGLLVTQSGCCGVTNFTECFTTIHSTLRSCFAKVHGYSAPIPSFGCSWGFNVAHHNPDLDLTSWTSDEVDAKIAERITGELKFLDGVSWHGVFGLPKMIRVGCEKEDRVMTKENPVFMY
eukprot:TRINITY_DN791_c0_g1_i1.p1 TRINITY_DN791_c0_g1~~TRINITY_DN791_c0_g1_i1.p1  ORF type:complete len:312 (-),score=100.92 TRINITY_DN791_c0_g1_i1:152-1087(-)